MPILLKEFIATHVEGHGLAVDALIEKFHREPPIAQDTIGSPFYDEHYKQQITHPDYNRLNYSVQKALVEKINLETRLYNQSRQPGFFGQSLEPKVIHVLNHCMSYDLLDLGNCSNRAAFAAFKLYDLLKDTPIKLHIKGVDNSGNIDHVVTYIGNSSLGWFIYDPLTNPLIVFAFDEYKTTIMPLFKSSIRKVRSFEVKMSDMLVEKYAIIYPQYREIMLKRIDDLCAIDLLKDPNLISSIEEKDQSLTKEQINKLVIIGCLALKARCADLMQPTSQENTDLVAAASSPLKK